MSGSPYDKRLHRNLRARLNKQVEAGRAYCEEPVCINKHGRWIEPGTPWHLAHDRATGGYHGTAHAACNESEGARHRHHSPTTHRPRPAWRSRAWGAGGSSQQSPG